MKGSRRTGGVQQAQEMAFKILEEFEEMLDYHHVKVPTVVGGRGVLCGMP